ncbi:MAG: Ig-like domain-containing protein [Prevotellaceae bacterium]|jgi:hypothetical protein|nr:Ig-like domain-containing protein [Prevotellaceae bacterium]
MKKFYFKMALVCLFTVVAISSCKNDEKDPVEVTGVTLNKTELTLNVGSSETLTATVMPNDADNKTVTWTTSDSTKVKVTVNGLVTAVAKGSAKIVASAGSKSDECAVTVTADTTITATVENGSSFNGEVDTVKAEIEYIKSNGRWDDYMLASAPYSNGGFTLKLPKEVSDLYLNALSEGEIPDSITVSNRNVKIGQVFLNAYESNYQVGNFYHGTADWEGFLIYANGNVSVTGSNTYTEINDFDGDGVPDETYTYTEKDNVHLKKGWNMVYTRETEKENNTYEYEMTTTAPSDAKWYFYFYDSLSDYYYSPNSVSSQLTKIPILSKLNAKKMN